MPVAPAAQSSTSWQDPMPDVIALASPEVGKSMTAKVEPLGNLVRKAAATIEAEIAVAPDDLVEALAPRLSGLGFKLSPAEAPRRGAWWILGQWLTGFALGSLDENSSFEDAESWFYGDIEGLPRIAPQGSLKEIAEMATPEQVWALLPYLLDPLAPGTRRHLHRDDGQASDRATRKAGGIFYTPADLARWMAGQVVPERGESWTCLDPACGSGVFLRAALEYDRTAVPFGVDIVPEAAQAAAFVVLASTSEDWVRSPWCGWQSARCRLATLDALQLVDKTAMDELDRRRRTREAEVLESRLREIQAPPPASESQELRYLGDVFPQLNAGADAFLCNPPYAQFGEAATQRDASRFRVFADHPPSLSSSLYPAFVELSWRALGQDGRASIVLPLSVASNRGLHFQQLRQAMTEAEGRWECAFFDRAPDALFGDDVKTRNSVLSLRAGEKGFAVTGLLRWTSRNRKSLFDTVQPVTTKLDVKKGIPKVSTPEEVLQLEALLRCEGRLAGDVVNTGKTVASEVASAAWPDSVFVGTTAYNWFNVLRDVRPAVEAGHESQAGFHVLRFKDAPSADAAYAVISSRLALWLWRVAGDGFHVNKSFLLNLPVQLGQVEPTLLEVLAALGRQVWVESSARRITAVNRGRKTVAFPPLADELVLSKLDRVVTEATGAVVSGHVADLGSWYRKLVVVDDLDQRRTKMNSPEDLPC
ncbi:MAG TPA: N-6 DNA methylase [Terrimicrobiaceae bacterium]|nr:N-6 DNA methylase [Terrimicrobiaceae bacterium]